MLTRREEHAQALTDRGLRISGKSDFTARVRASADPAELRRRRPRHRRDEGDPARTRRHRELAGRFPAATVMTIQNGLGAEELVRGVRRLAADLGGHVHERRPPRRRARRVRARHRDLARAVRRHRDATSRRRRSRRCSSRPACSARAFPDLRPAQWSKLIFNATVNTVSALTDLPHVGAFAARDAAGDLGHLVHDLIAEGKAVAAAAGVELHEDPWEMNVHAVRAARRSPPRVATPTCRRCSRTSARAARPRSTSSPARSSARRPGTACRCRCTPRCTGS